MNNLLISLGIMAVSVLLVSPAPGAAQAEEQSVGETGRVVARVNGKPIYQEQLEPAVERDLGKFRKYGMRKDSPNLVERLQMRALHEMIDQELIYQESKRRNVEDLEEKVEQRLQAMKKKHGSPDRFERHLEMRDLTVEDLRESLRRRVYVDEYLEAEGITDPEIPEERIREFYEANPENYWREETIEVSHVLIEVDANAATEQKEQARKRAEQIRGEIADGEDFAEMARRNSDCNSAPGGGSLGYVKRGYMPEEFDRVAFAMETGAVSDVVETKFGYHVIRVTDRKPAGLVPYQEAKDLIRKLLQSEESRMKRDAHIAALRKRAEIEILLGDPH